MSKLCSVPWQEIYINPELQYSLCCKEDQALTQKIPISNHSLSDHWNGEYINNIRSRFLNNVNLPECDLCWNEENLNKISMRMRKNERYFGKTEISEHDLIGAEKNPKGILLSVGNQCQLRCISCNPNYSRSILKDYDKLNWDYNVKSRFNIKNSSYTTTSLDQHTVNQLKNITPSLEWLSITGGEPTLSKPLLEYLNWCVDKGYSKNIIIMINTNGVNVKDNFLRTLEKFKYVLFSISVDGYKELDEYLRWPTNWNKKEKLVKTSIDIFPKVILHSVVYSLNCFNVHDLINWMTTFNAESSLETLHYPNELAVEHIPSELKLQLIKKIKNFKLNNKNTYLQNCIDALVARLNIVGNNLKWEQCKHIITAYDSIRETKLYNLVPELKGYY